MLRIDKLVARVKRQFDSGRDALKSRRGQWKDCVDRIIEVFDKVKLEAEKQQLFENLYVSDSRKVPSLNQGPQLVTLWWGQHPVGSGTIEKPSKLAVEGGAVLTFSQGVDGSVLCIIYPFESDLHSALEKNLVLRIFKKPDDVTLNSISCALRAFFSYSLVTSIFGAPTCVDTMLIAWYRFKDRCRKTKKGKLFLKMLTSIGGAVFAIVKAAHAVPS